MISELEYFKFSRKFNKIRKVSFVGMTSPAKPEMKPEFRAEGVYGVKGSTSFTKDNIYYFNLDVLQQHKDAILELCDFFPKLNTVKPNTKGTIAFIDLMPDIQYTMEILIRYSEDNDKFVSMLVLTGLGERGKFIGTDKFSAVTIDLCPKYNLDDDYLPVQLAEYEKKAKHKESYWEFAAFKCGEMYYHGKGTTKDIDKAVYWHKFVCENSNDDFHISNSAARLGIIYRYGDGGVAADDEKAFHYYKIAAEGGRIDAQYEVGAITFDKAIDCDDLNKSYRLFDEAFGWFKKAVEKVENSGGEYADNRAFYMLARCYNEGLGTGRNPDKARYYFQKAADRGHKEAQEALLFLKA